MELARRAGEGKFGERGLHRQLRDLVLVTFDDEGAVRHAHRNRNRLQSLQRRDLNIRSARQGDL